MKKNLVFTAVALAGSLALAPHAWTQQYDQQQQTPQQRGTQQQPSYGEQQRGTQQQPAYRQQQQQREQQAGQQQRQFQYAQQLAAAEDLKDMKLQDMQGEDLGSVDKVVIDTQEGKVAYVVVTTGGFWGIGGEKAIVPWNALNIQQAKDQDEQILVLNVREEQLKNAPQGEFEEVVTNQEQARQIHQFYGVSPYWEEGAQQKPRGMQERMQQREHMPQQQQQQERMQQPQQRQQSQ